MPFSNLSSLSPAPRSRRGTFDMLSCQKVRQLAFGLVLAAAIADLLHSGMDGFGHAADDAAGLITGVRFPDQHVSGLAWTLLGSILTHDFVRQLSRHPGEDNFSSTIPAKVLGFGFLLIWSIVGRFDSSWLLVLDGSFLTLPWYSLVQMLPRRVSRERLLLTPGGTERYRAHIKGLEWLKPSQPQDMALARESDGVTDLGSHLSKDWSGFLIKCASEGLPVCREAHGLHASSGIFFNRESPRRGQTFINRMVRPGVVATVLNRASRLSLGYLDAECDWGHARDNVEGMWRMLQPETPGNHVLATGRKNAVRLFVTLAFTCADIDIVWDGEGIAERGFGRNTGSILFEVDPRCFRPTEVDLLLGDTSKARRPLGRELRMPFEQMTAELVTSDIRLLERAKLLDRVRSPDGTGR